MTFKTFIRRKDPRISSSKEMADVLSGMGLFLGGSRSKVPEMCSSDTDWDFSFEDSTLVPRLEELGFVRQVISGEHLEKYSDISFRALWKHPNYEIDVIQRWFFDRYKTVWSLISKEYYKKYLWKSSPNRDPDKVGEHKEQIRDTLNMFLLMAGDRHG